MADGLRAFAEIRIHGAQPWRLVDRCAREGIVLRDAREIDAFTLTARIPLRERERVEVLAGRCGCTLELVRESFVPRLQKKLHRRAADAVLFLLCLQILVLEGLSAFCVISDDVAVSDQAVFVSNQTVQTYRTSRVELACADADFSSEAVTESVSESGRAVLVNACGIHV